MFAVMSDLSALYKCGMHYGSEIEVFIARPETMKTAEPSINCRSNKY